MNKVSFVKFDIMNIDWICLLDKCLLNIYTNFAAGFVYIFENTLHHSLCDAVVGDSTVKPHYLGIRIAHFTL